MEKLIFYVFALILLLSATMVISVRNPVKAALFLILAFFTSAAIWLLLHAEFLAITLVLVYVGAVLVLFLFVVMMLDIDVAPLKECFTRYLPLGIVVSALIVVEMITVVNAPQFALPAPAVAEDISNTRSLGLLLYTIYVYPFEIASVILTVAIVAAITLTLRSSKRKSQDASWQVKVRAQDRLRLVDLPTEVKDKGTGS